MGKKKTDGLNQFVFRMLDTQKEELIKLANRDDRSVSATIRRAINEYIDNHKPV